MGTVSSEKMISVTPSDVKVIGDQLHITFEGRDFQFPFDKISTTLTSATQIERETYNISPSGYGIHWPLIDEDLSVGPLLRSLEK